MTDELRGIAAKVEAAARQLAELEQRQAEAIAAAHQAGMTWADLARILHLSDGTAVRLKVEAALGTTASGDSPEDGVGETVSVTEAARRLGVARSTIYERIDRGELRAVLDGRGRTRVCWTD